jgi:1-deoxy-D-xylulose-5-phosphate reductoisomerase
MPSTTVGVAVLGATGSIGASTLDLIMRHPERYAAVALSAHRSVDALIDLCRRHRPRLAVLSGIAEDAHIRKRFAESGFAGELRFGAAALEEVARREDVTVVMAAIVGAAGLASTLAAAAQGKRVLLANKEALVMAGPLLMRAVRSAGAVLLPIDSEHNAVFQCLPQGDAAGRPSLRAVRRVLLTASGGPFRTLSADRLEQVTPDEACAHPNWVMGRKISVDSATMMNKGLEVIEARWLFDLPAERIEVVIHPQSVVHSLVEYIDGSVIAQLSNPDMRVPIAHALAYPERIESGVAPLDLGGLGQLSFEPPDTRRFPCLQLAYRALDAGGTAPTLLNAANELAVEAFLAGRLRFTSIAAVIEDVLAKVPAGNVEGLEALLGADALGRRAARAAIDRYQARAA